eukprot:Gb_41431 [translate_table: standard]
MLQDCMRTGSYDVACLLASALNVPMVLTGHSLGRNKLEKLLKQGMQSKKDINSTYKLMRRIEAEELSLDSVELVVTKKLRDRTKSSGNCYMPRMVVMPPGMDFSNVIVQEESTEADSDNDSSQRLAIRTEGIFINPALVEPFGLTLIEPTAHRLTMVATKNGGPAGIERTFKNGMLAKWDSSLLLATTLQDIFVKGIPMQDETSSVAE